mmetsp:Transcript_89084/g.140723  ORF Transcript_89084/g.140723 Transcript_89084/m.140723 type:complete len:222 (+) Transcript_89084:1635-2300(+)
MRKTPDPGPPFGGVCSFNCIPQLDSFELLSTSASQTPGEASAAEREKRRQRELTVRFSNSACISRMTDFPFTMTKRSRTCTLRALPVNAALYFPIKLSSPTSEIENPPTSSRATCKFKPSLSPSPRSSSTSNSQRSLAKQQRSRISKLRAPSRDGKNRAKSLKTNGIGCSKSNLNGKSLAWAVGDKAFVDSATDPFGEVAGIAVLLASSQTEFIPEAWRPS